MALIKTMIDDSGISATYWKITNMTFNYPAQGLLTLRGYVSNTYADAKKAAIVKKILIPVDLTLAAAYIYLKTRPEFNGAIDG